MEHLAQQNVMLLLLKGVEDNNCYQNNFQTPKVVYQFIFGTLHTVQTYWNVNYLVSLKGLKDLLFCFIIDSPYKSQATGTSKERYTTLNMNNNYESIRRIVFIESNKYQPIHVAYKLEC